MQWALLHPVVFWQAHDSLAEGLRPLLSRSILCQEQNETWMPKPPSSLFQSLTPLGIHSGCSTSTSLLVSLTCPILSRHGLHTRLYAESLIGHLSSKKVAPYPTSETAICGHLLFDISYNTSVHKNRNFIRLFLCLAVRSQ